MSSSLLWFNKPSAYEIERINTAKHTMHILSNHFQLNEHQIAPCKDAGITLLILCPVKTDELSYRLEGFGAEVFGRQDKTF